jgi:predicted transcriptional regulator
MKNINIKYGEILKKAEQFEKLQEELSQVIKSSNINKTQLLQRIEMSETALYFRFKEKDFNAEQLIQIFTAILDIQKSNCSEIYRALFKMQNLNTMKKT